MKTLNTLSNIILHLAIPGLLLAALLASCSHAVSVGDYYSRNGDEGIVVAVDAFNNPTLLLATSEIADIDADSALAWAATLENGWKLPDKSQMKLVLKHRSLINITLEKRSQPTILKNHTFYWTADSCSRSQHYACGPNGIQCYFHSSHSPSYRARAVKELR